MVLQQLVAVGWWIDWQMSRASACALDCLFLVLSCSFADLLGARVVEWRKTLERALHQQFKTGNCGVGKKPGGGAGLGLAGSGRSFVST